MTTSLTLVLCPQSFAEGNVMVWGMTPDILLLWITVALAIVAMVVYAFEAVKKIHNS